MAKIKAKALQLGLFIFLSFLLFIAGILILGQKTSMFTQTIKISTMFHDVRGLQVGNNVRLTGIDVGAVDAITIISDTAVLVEMSMHKDVVGFIKKDSKATIGNDGLMGSKIVILLPGDPDSPTIEPGDQLPAIEPVEMDEIMVEVRRSSEKISIVADNLIEITDKINRGDGIFGKLFTDSELTERIDESGKNIAELAASLNELLGKMNSGEGLMGKLINDEELGQRIDETTVDLREVVANLEEFTNRLNEGESVLGQLMSDTTFSSDLATMATNLSEVSEKLNAEDNALHKFINDPEFADSVEVMLFNLNKGLREVTEASEALQRSGLIRAFSKDVDKKKKD